MRRGKRSRPAPAGPVGGARRRPAAVGRVGGARRRAAAVNPVPGGRRRPAVVGPVQGAPGQATVETIALAPIVLAIGLGILQLLAAGYASVLAGNAAEAGALALAGGADPRAGARRSLPGWSRARARVEVAGGRVTVHLRPPSPLKALADGLEVTASAAVEAQ